MEFYTVENKNFFYKYSLLMKTRLFINTFNENNIIYNYKHIKLSVLVIDEK